VADAVIKAPDYAWNPMFATPPPPLLPSSALSEPPPALAVRPHDCRQCADNEQLLQSSTAEARQTLTNAATCRWHEACIYA
jgi:hypothetical protein